MSVRRTLAALGAVALLLTGCSGDPKPKMSPTSPPPNSQSTTAQPMSAEDFVRAWVELYNAMQRTGKTSEYRRASAKCPACLDVADRVDKEYGSGGHIQTAGWSVRRLVLNGDGSSLDVDLYVKSAPVRVVHSDGSIERLPGGPAHFLIGVKQVGSAWVATSLGLYEQ